MSSTVRIFLSTELTGIPGSIRGIIGDNLNNTLCNGVTWLCAIWSLLYYCHNTIVTTCLKTRGFSLYLRDRLSNSLWSFAVFTFFTLSYFLTLDEYLTSDLLDVHRLVSYRPDDVKDVTPNIALSHAIVLAFFLFMAFNEGIRLNSPSDFTRYSALLAFNVLAYQLRLFQLYFTLIALVSFSAIFEELAKLSYSLMKCQNIFGKSAFFLYKLALLVFVAVYFIAVPGTVLLPLALALFFTKASMPLLFLFIFLFCWYSIVLYKSALFKLMTHYVHHNKDCVECPKNEACKDEIKQIHCSGSFIECSLFAPRTDEAYKMALLRHEANQRQKRVIALRKPKGRGMLMQTLKCMMTIKKKLNKRKFGKKGSDDFEDSDDDLDVGVLIEELTDDTDDGESENGEDMKKSGNIAIFPADEEAINEEHSEEPEMEVKITYTDDVVDKEQINREDELQITDVTIEEEAEEEPIYRCAVETDVRLDDDSKDQTGECEAENSDKCGQGNGKTC